MRDEAERCCPMVTCYCWGFAKLSPIYELIYSFVKSCNTALLSVTVMV